METLVLQKQKEIEILQNIKSATKLEKKVYLSYKNDKCIKDFTEDQDEDLLYKILWKWENYAGFVNNCSPQEFNINFEFIQNNFGFLNIRDIDTAINLAASGELEINKSKADESFSRLSPTYIGRVLQSYISIRKEFIHKVKNEISKEELKPKPLTDEQLLNSFKSYLVYAFTQKIKKEEISNDGNRLYDFIYHNKLIDITEQLIDEARIFAIDNLNKKSKTKSEEDQSTNQTSLSKSIGAILNLKQKETKTSIEDNTKEAIELRRINFCKKHIVNVWLEKMTFISEKENTKENQIKLLEKLNVFLDSILIDDNRKFTIKTY